MLTTFERKIQCGGKSLMPLANKKFRQTFLSIADDLDRTLILPFECGKKL